MSMTALNQEHRQNALQRKEQYRRTVGEKLTDCWRILFSCCSVQDDEDEYESRKPLQISAPTNFQRVELELEGLSAEELDRYRRKQAEDARQMFTNLRPLASSPSTHFAERPHPPSVTYEQFTQPRTGPGPPPHSSNRHSSVLAGHVRKLSGQFRKHSLGNGFVAATGGRLDEDVEMRALMDPSKNDVHVATTAAATTTTTRTGRGDVKGCEMSEESIESREDSAKGGIEKF